MGPFLRETVQELRRKQNKGTENSVAKLFGQQKNLHLPRLWLQSYVAAVFGKVIGASESNPELAAPTVLA